MYGDFTGVWIFTDVFPSKSGVMSYCVFGGSKSVHPNVLSILMTEREPINIDTFIRGFSRDITDDIITLGDGRGR